MPTPTANLINEAQARYIARLAYDIGLRAANRDESPIHEQTYVVLTQDDVEGLDPLPIVIGALDARPPSVRRQDSVQLVQVNVQEHQHEPVALKIDFHMDPAPVGQQITLIFEIEVTGSLTDKQQYKTCQMLLEAAHQIQHAARIQEAIFVLRH